MRLGYPEFQTLDAEILAVTATPPERGPHYHQLFKFVHPYLCDPGMSTIRRYGLPARRGAVVLGAIRALISDPVFRRESFNAPAGLPRLVREENDMPAGQLEGFYAIDKLGIVRFARATCGSDLLPSNAEIVQLLATLDSQP